MLRESDNFKTVNLAPDLTKAQRILQKNLIDERNKDLKNAEGNIDGSFYFEIRNGKVVKLMQSAH